MKKVTRHIAFSLLYFVIGVYLILFVLLRIPAAQTFIAQKVEKSLSEKIDSKVHIGRVDIRPFNRVVIDDAIIYDQKNRKMLKAARISAAIELLPLISGRISLSAAQLFGTNITLYKESAESDINCQFLLDSLSSESDKESKLNLHIASLIIRNCTLSYDRLDIPHRNDVFSPHHIGISGLSANIVLHYITDENLKIGIGRLNFKEASGLTCNNMIADIEASFNDKRKSFNVRDFKLEMPHSNVEIPYFNLSFNTPNGSIDNNSIALSTQLDTREITPSDLAALLNIKNCSALPSLSLHGNISVKDSRLESDVTARSTHNKDITLNAHVTASDLFGKYCAKAVVKELAVSEKLITSLSEQFEIPQEVTRLGEISMKGNVGLCANTDYNLNAEIKTQHAGSADIDLTCTKNAGNTVFDAKIETAGINIANILKDNIVGEVKGKVKAKGSLTPDYAIRNLNLDCNIDNIAYDHQQYDNISIKGNYADKQLKGLVSISDPKIHFSANIDSKIDKLTIDAITGNLSINDLTLPQYDTELNNLSISSTSNGSQKTIRLTTDFADLTLSGMIQPSTLYQSLTNLITSYLPNIPSLPAHVPTHNDYHIEGHIDNLDFIKKITDIPIHINGQATVSGRIVDDTHFADLTVCIPSLTFEEKTLNSTELHIFTPYHSLNTSLATTIQTDITPIKINIDCIAENNNLFGAITWNNQRENAFKGTLNTQTNFYNTFDGRNAFHVSINDSKFEIGDTIWNINSKNIAYSNKRLTINQLNIGNDTQHIYINGICSSSENDTLSVNMKNINVDYILNLVDFHSVQFDGKATGEAKACGIFGNLDASAHLKVDDFMFQYGNMGTLYADATYDNLKKQIDINAIADDAANNAKTLIEGYISPNRSDIELNIEAVNTRLDFMRDFCGTFLDNINLNGDGKVKLAGPFSALELTGQIVANGSAHVIPTNCRYELLSDTVTLIPGDITFKKAHIKDKYGNSAYVTGGIHHHHLGRMSYDVHVDADKFLAYDIPTLDNSTFCGRAVIKGDVDINGRGNDIYIQANATTLKDTYLTYNTTSPDAITNSDFITWGSMGNTAEKDSSDIANKTADNTLSADIQRTNIRMKFNVNVTPDAKLHLLMDAITGDFIDLYGKGELQINYYNKGSLHIFGNYDIDNGIYRMTIQNLIRREFAFQQGSIIGFGGDPFEAILRMKAAYMLNSVSLADLNIGTSFKTNNVPVNCIMNISGVAGQPVVEFNLDLPTLESDAKQMVYSIINSEESMNKQVLYLLAIGRFYSNNNDNRDNNEHIGQTALAMQSFLSGTFSQQLNQVLNQLTNNTNWSIGANIATGTDGFSNAEYEGILNGKMLNNRLLFNGQFGYRDNIMKNSQSFIGDFSIQYLLTPNGNISLKMYNQSNDRYFTRNSLNTQGLGIVFKKEFGK